MTPHVGRFAPSPTGLLHLGNARSALLGWLWARASGGKFLLRIEDLDVERCRPHFTDAIFRDLEWLGLTWDGPVWRQSQRSEVYRDAVETLRREGRVYPCWCSRAEVARVASAPHAGEDGPVYPGTCRAGGTPKPGRAPALRFNLGPGGNGDDARGETGQQHDGQTGLHAVGEGLAPLARASTTFTDEIKGEVSQDVAREVGDFVIQRIDGVASYQLAVVVDDAASGVTHVLRGEDLLASTPRQLLLQRALGLPQPVYAHVPLLLGPDGKRLAKRDGPSTVAGLRDEGWNAEKVVGFLAASCGILAGETSTAAGLVADFSLKAVRP